MPTSSRGSGRRRLHRRARRQAARRARSADGRVELEGRCRRRIRRRRGRSDRAYRRRKKARRPGGSPRFDGASGKQLWKADADGISSARRGRRVASSTCRSSAVAVDRRRRDRPAAARIRGIDEEISMLRVTSRGRVLRLEAGRVPARRAQRYRQARRRRGTRGRGPAAARQDHVRPRHLRSGPGRYTAADRSRVLWAASRATGHEARRRRYAVHYFRFVFGFDHKGALSWAYSNPRVELVASEDTGNAIVAISPTGEYRRARSGDRRGAPQELAGTVRRCSARRSMPMAGRRRRRARRSRPSRPWSRSRAITMRASIA